MRGTDRGALMSFVVISFTTSYIPRFVVRQRVAGFAFCVENGVGQVYGSERHSLTFNL